MSCNVVEHRINCDYLIELSRFADSDKDIANCRQKIHDEVFRHDWFVGLFKEGAPFFQLEFFNKPFFKNQLQLFYLNAHDFLLRFGFVGYYRYRDIDAWIDHVSTNKRATTLEEDEEEDDDYRCTISELEQNILETFPFGVIPLGISSMSKYGQYVQIENRLTMRKHLAYQPFDPEIAERFEFHVIDRGAMFVPMSEYVQEHSIRINSLSRDLVPTSQFADLYHQKQLIKEATKTEFDANSMHVYPESYIIAKPQKDAALDDVADNTLYALDDILNAKQYDNMQREAMGLDNARYHAQRIAMKRNVTMARNGRCGGAISQEQNQPSTIIWDQKLEYGRPSQYETIRFIPQSVEIVPGKVGMPVVNLERRVEKYERDVCRAMRIPYSFINPDFSGSTKNKETSKGLTTSAENDRNQRMLESEVRRQHALFNDVFADVYRQTFGTLDSQLFNATPNPALFSGLTGGVHFDHVLVKSEASLANLTHFFELGIVPLKQIQRVVFNEHNLELPSDVEPPIKRRKLEPELLVDEEK